MWAEMLRPKRRNSLQPNWTESGHPGITFQAEIIIELIQEFRHSVPVIKITVNFSSYNPKSHFKSASVNVIIYFQKFPLHFLSVR